MNNTVKKIVAGGLVVTCVAIPTVTTINLKQKNTELEATYIEQVQTLQDTAKRTSIGLIEKVQEVENHKEALKKADEESEILLKSLEEKQKEIDTLTARVSGLEKEVQELESVKQRIINSVGYLPTKEEINLLERLVFCEAGDESLTCQIAIVNVVLNRVKSKEFPNTINGVITQSGQFSPVGSGWIKTVNATSQNKEAVKRALKGEKIVSSNTKYFFATWLDKNHIMWNSVKVTKTIGETNFGCEWE